MPMVKYTSDKIGTNKSAMRCQYCDFTCTFASQLIQHKKCHSNDSKTNQKVLNINVHLAKKDKTASFNDEIKGSNLLEKSSLQPESKKEITLKKIRFNNANQAQHNEGAANACTLKNCIPNTARVITVKTFDVKSKQSEAVSNCLNALSSFQENDKTKDDNSELNMPSSLLTSASLCGQCNYVAKNKDDLMAHKAEHEIIYSCTECDYRTHVRKNFERHEWCHVVDFPFKCQYCSFSSNADNAVKRHITSYHLSIRNNKEKHKSSDILDSGLPVKIVKVAQNSSHNDSTGKLLDDIVIEHKDEGGSSKWHCHSCNMDFNNQLSTDKHAKLVHNKFLKDCVVVGKMESSDLTDNLECNDLIDNSECQKALSNHSIQKIKTFVINRSSKQKDHSPSKINKNVFKCAHCTFVTDQFDKLKHHLEHESNNPNHAAKTTIKLNTDKKTMHTAFVAEKLQNCVVSKKLENITSNEEPVLEVKKSSDHMKKKSTNDNEVVKPITNLTSKLISLECSEVDDKLLPLVDKLKVKCLFCKYMTYSAKCLKKHLLREHSSIVVNKKLLQEFTRKCFIYSLENASQMKKNEDEETQRSDLFPSDSNTEETCLDDKASEGVMLQMSVQSENIKTSLIKKPKLTDLPIKLNDNFIMSNISNTRRNVFKCSVCNRTSNFKCNIKKHIEAIHPNATIIHYKNRMEPDGNKLVLVNPEKFIPKELEKISFLENEQIIDVKIEIDESLSNKGNKVAQETDTKGNKIGMADDLRIKRFKCSVCPYRSNFRNNISNHVNMRHKNSTGAHFFVMSVEEAKETLPFYSYKRYDFELYTNNDGENYTKQNGHIKETSPNDDSFDNDQPNYVVAMKNFDKDEPKKCRICPFVTNKSEILKLHMNYHQPQKRNELSCPYCPFFVNTTRLMRHHLALHEASNNNHQTSSRQVNCSYSNGSLNYAVNCNNVNNNLNGTTAPGTCSDLNGLKNVFNWNFFISNVKFCRAKYICEHCPFTSDERGDYWYHRKCHIDRDDRINHLKCDKCLYWAEDKKDYAQHISLHDLIYSPKVKLNQSDLSIGEFCRCDFANFKNFPDLACFKQLVCCYCSYKCSSVLLMRQHSVTHVAFSDANNSRLFKWDLDDADDVLGNLCSRLLNMNYSLAEESFDVNKSSKTSSLNDKRGFGHNGSKPTGDGDGDDQKNDESHNNTDDNDSMEMPILEKMSELPTGTYDPHVLSVHLPTSSTPPCYTPVNSRKEGANAVQATTTTVTEDLNDDAMNKFNIEHDNEATNNESTSQASFIFASDPVSSFNNWIVEDEKVDDTSILSGPEEIIKSESDIEGEMEVGEEQLPNGEAVIDEMSTSKPRIACVFAKTIYMNSLGLTHAG